MIDRGPTDRFAAPLRQAVKTVAGLNLIYFDIEFTVALAIGSVSLFADSIDFLEDATVNGLILIALGWSAQPRALLGMAMAVVLLVPSAATAWMAWEKFALPVPPAPLPLSLAGSGALAINLFCTITLARFRSHAGSLTRAAWLSARNDALANLAIIAAGSVTAVTLSAWSDLIRRARHIRDQSRRCARGLYGGARRAPNPATGALTRAHRIGSRCTTQLKLAIRSQCEQEFRRCINPGSSGR